MGSGLARRPASRRRDPLGSGRAARRSRARRSSSTSGCATRSGKERASIGAWTPSRAGREAERGTLSCPTRFPDMELRIGVVDTPKELSLEIDGTADDVIKAIEDALGSEAPRAMLVVDRHQGPPRRHSRRPHRLHRDRGRRRHPARRLRPLAERPSDGRRGPTCSTVACSSSPARAASARAPSPRRPRCSPPSGASACCSSRSTPRATSPRSSSTPRSASSPARCTRASTRCR